MCFVVRGIGAGLILLGCYFYGYYEGELYYRKSKVYEELWELFEAMEEEIRYGIHALPVLCQRLSQQRREKPVSGAMMRQIAKSLEQKKSWEEALEEGLVIVVKKTAVPWDEIAFIQTLLTQAAGQDKNHMERSIELCKSRLKKREQDSLQEYQKKAKVYRYLGTFLGLLSILLLL